MRCSNEEWASAAQQLAWISRQDVVPMQWWPVVLKDAENLLANSSFALILLTREIVVLICFTQKTVSPFHKRMRMSYSVEWKR